MPVEFDNADVAAKYVPAREKDGHVHVPAGKKTAKNPNPVGYAGLLSNITLVCADKAFASGSNILKLKDEKSSTVPTPSNNGEHVEET